MPTTNPPLQRSRSDPGKPLLLRLQHSHFAAECELDARH